MNSYINRVFGVVIACFLITNLTAEIEGEFEQVHGFDYNEHYDFLRENQNDPNMKNCKFAVRMGFYNSSKGLLVLTLMARGEHLSFYEETYNKRLGFVTSRKSYLLRDFDASSQDNLPKIEEIYKITKKSGFSNEGLIDGYNVFYRWDSRIGWKSARLPLSAIDQKKQYKSIRDFFGKLREAAKAKKK